MKIKRARHKTGRDKIPTSFSISLSQINWLNDHKEINQSHLVTSLLGDYIETFDNIQPDSERLIIRRHALQDQLEKTEPKLNETERIFCSYNRDYMRELTYMQNIQNFSKLPAEKLTVDFNKYGTNEVYLSAVDDKGTKMHVSFEHQGIKEPQQVITTLQNELKKVEAEDYKAKFENLKRDKMLAESIYNTYNQKHENIKKQIEEIELLLINQKISLFNK